EAILMEGAATGLADSSTFAKLTDPLFDNLGDVAFLATLQDPSITGSKGQSQSLWTNAWGASLALIARTGVAALDGGSPAAPGAPSGVPAGASYGKILSAALDGPAGGTAAIAFTATLKSGAVSGSNNQGLWAADAQG